MSFVTLHTGLSGVQASQTGIDVTSNNIANSGTIGYTRQRVNQSPKYPFHSPNGIVGTGVKIDEIIRLRDTFLDARVRDATAQFAAHDTRAAVLERLEVVYGEPDAGITSELDELWASLEDLSLDPAAPANRIVALSALQRTTARINEVGDGTTALLADTRDARALLLDEAQGLIDQIAEINYQVANASDRFVSNNLLDQRDLYADRLAGILGANTTQESDGTYTMTVGGQDIVSGSVGATLSIVGDDFQVDGTTVPHTTMGGEMAGLQRVILEDVPQTRAELEDFVVAFADAFNAQHQAGFTTAGAAGGAVFSYTAGDAASTLTVLLTDVDQLATAGGVGTGLHDATNAIALADLRITPRGDARTHDEALRQAVVGLGARVSGAGRAAGAAAEIATTAEVNRTSAHGVSLDEEMVALVQYQRALEANARVMTAADEMLDTVINRLGRVGT